MWLQSRKRSPVCDKDELRQKEKKQKGTSSWSQRHSGSQEAPIPPSIPCRSLFSSEEQRTRYTNLFSSRSIVDPKFIDMEFFSNENFECFQAFENSNLIPFMSLKLPVYSELVKAFFLSFLFCGAIFIETYQVKLEG